MQSTLQHTGAGRPRKSRKIPCHYPGCHRTFHNQRAEAMHYMRHTYGNQTGQGIVTKEGALPAGYRHKKTAPRSERSATRPNRQPDGLYHCPECENTYGSTNGLDGHTVTRHKLKMVGPGVSWRKDPARAEAALQKGNKARAKTKAPNGPPRDSAPQDQTQSQQIPATVQDLMRYMGASPAPEPQPRGRGPGRPPKDEPNRIEAMFQGFRGQFVGQGMHTDLQVVCLAIRVKRETLQEIEHLISMVTAQ